VYRRTTNPTIAKATKHTPRDNRRGGILREKDGPNNLLWPRLLLAIQPNLLSRVKKDNVFDDGMRERDP
jgi:hypothetical protein